MYMCLDINSTMYIIKSKSFFVYFVYYYLYVVDNDHGMYRIPRTAIPLFQDLLYLSDCCSVSHNTNEFGRYKLH